MADLAGQQVTQSRADEVGALPACLYMVENSDKVQVIDVPASQWSRELPALLDQVEQSGVVDDPETRDKFAAARKQLEAEGSLDDDAACALFSDLLEIQGLPAGEERIVNLVPNREKPRGVNGQTCTDGVYTSVQLQAADLTDTKAVVATGRDRAGRRPRRVRGVRPTPATGPGCLRWARSPRRRGR